MSLQIALNQIQECIRTIPKQPIREALNFQYLTATRISEVAGKYAITKEALTTTTYKDREIALFEIKTAKREGITRIIALPLETASLKEVLAYFNKADKGQIYKTPIRTISAYCEKYFHDLKYDIESYQIPTYYNEYEKVARHQRRATTHFLRHQRLTDLMMNHGFDDVDLAIFAGWTLKGMARRYVTAQWGRYIGKLF